MNVPTESDRAEISTCWERFHLVAMFIQRRRVFHIDCMHCLAWGCCIASSRRACSIVCGTGLCLWRGSDGGGIDGCDVITTRTLNRLCSPGIHERDVAKAADQVANLVGLRSAQDVREGSMWQATVAPRCQKWC